MLALAFSAYGPVCSTALGQSPIEGVDSDASVRFNKLARELKDISYPVDYDELLSLVHRYSETDPSFGISPPPGTDGLFYSFLMLREMQRSTVENYLIEIVYRSSNEKRSIVTKARLCIRSKSGYFFYWDDQEPTFYRVPNISRMLKPAG